MGRRWFENRIKKAHASFTSTWGNNPGAGKFWKRRLNRALRRIARGTGGDERGIVGKRSTVSWRNW